MATPSTYLDFERPVADLETKIAELQEAGGSVVSEEVSKLREKSAKQLKDIYSKLSPWQKTQVARHLLIGIRAMERLREMPLERLHSRKLRSFQETAFL